MALDLSDLPANLKSIQPYLKIANQYEDRDPVVTYWARLYALQTAIKIGKSREERGCLMKLMEWLETYKQENRENEAITNETTAREHITNWANKLFVFADQNDRLGNFSKNVIQSFYTSGMLYDILSTFGELQGDAARNGKYAKQKATYIHTCLKNGETPIAGPLENDLDGGEEEDEEEVSESPKPDGFPSPAKPDGLPTPPRPGLNPNASTTNFPSISDPAKTLYTPPADFKPNPNISTPQQAGNVVLDADQVNKTQKYIKWAGSAMNYDDIPTAIENLQKALHLLTTGQDS